MASHKHSADLREESFLVDKNKELLLPEQLSETLRSYSWTRLQVLLMKTVKRKCKRHSTTPCLARPPSLLPIE